MRQYKKALPYTGTERDIAHLVSLLKHVQDLPRSVFVPPTEKDFKACVGGDSRLLMQGDVCVGCLLVDGRYINTIVSIVPQGATVLVSDLKGIYLTHVSPLNKRSLKFFGKYSARLLSKVTMDGEERGYYDIVF